MTKFFTKNLLQRCIFIYVFSFAVNNYQQLKTFFFFQSKIAQNDSKIILSQSTIIHKFLLSV